MWGGGGYKKRNIPPPLVTERCCTVLSASDVLRRSLIPLSNAIFAPKNKSFPRMFSLHLLSLSRNLRTFRVKCIFGWLIEKGGWFEGNSIYVWEVINNSGMFVCADECWTKGKVAEEKGFRKSNNCLFKTFSCIKFSMRFLCRLAVSNAEVSRL